MKLTIEKFSSIFCFGHSGLSSTKEGDLCCDIREYKDLEYEEIFDTIEMFSLKYSKQFMEAVVKIFITDIKNDFASKKKFMSFVLSRCIALSETPTPVSFILVCVFVNTVISGVLVPLDLECFTLAKMASKCLISAFYRQYVDLFDKENGFEGLANYCEKLNETILSSSDEDSETGSKKSSINHERFFPLNTDELMDLLSTLKEVDHANFLLTEFEEKLLYEQDSLPLDIKTFKDIFIHLDDSKIERSDIVMQNLRIKFNLILEHLNEVCMLCKDNCYKHVVFAAKELEVGGI